MRGSNSKYFRKHSQKYSNIFQRLSWWHARDKSMVGSKTNKSRSCSKPPDLISASQPLVTWGQTNIFCKKLFRRIIWGKRHLGSRAGSPLTLPKSSLNRSGEPPYWDPLQFCPGKMTHIVWIVTCIGTQTCNPSKDPCLGEKAWEGKWPIWGWIWSLGHP